jgi:3-deoxy-D-manno-octulosonic-acid transferase
MKTTIINARISVVCLACMMMFHSMLNALCSLLSVIIVSVIAE